MAQKYEFRKGFLKLQRLGPVKFTEQSRWAARAPESKGLWAFPFPHFDLFYAYHKYTDLAPKHLRGRWPSDPKYYDREDELDYIPRVEFRESTSSVFRDRKEAGFTDEQGNWVPLYLSGRFYEEQDAWVKNVGEKILPLRTFWYSGDLYTHFNHDGTVGNWTMGSGESGNEWSLMSSEKLANLLRRPGSVIAADGHRPDGKPATYRFSADHLELFIPPRRGVIRDKL